MYSKAELDRMFCVDWCGKQDHKESHRRSRNYKTVKDALIDKNTPDDAWATLRDLAEGIGVPVEKPAENKIERQWDKSSACILVALLERHPTLASVPDLAAATDLSSATVKERLRKLIELNQVHRPYGANSGAGLTETGRTLAVNIRATQT